MKMRKALLRELRMKSNTKSQNQEQRELLAVCAFSGERCWRLHIQTASWGTEELQGAQRPGCPSSPFAMKSLQESFWKCKPIKVMS
jgi:hypothetical protein